MMSEDESDEPPSKRSVIVVRPVIKGMYDKSASRLAASSASTRSLMNTVRPPRPPGSMRIRPVIPGTLRHFETTRSSSRVLLKDEEEDNDANMQAKTLPSTLPTTSSSFMSREETPLIDTDTGSTVTTLSREPTLEISPESPSALRLSTPVPTDSEPERAEPRRTRRPQVSYTSKAPSSSVTSSKGDPTALTRTTTMVQRGGMLSKATPRSTSRSATPLGGLPANPRQLQAITQANTVRNQVYFADLQRKVVRRYGPRPASPTTKVRTIIEKSKEERSKEREARARRRRRDEGSNMTASSDGDYIDAPSSPTSEGLVSRSGPVIKHIRGPGDEEDYETPERPLKPSRIDPNKLAKNVKWDRGLAIKISEWATEQKEDEMREGERVAAVRKGCLARDPAVMYHFPTRFCAGILTFMQF
ncbi:hypothetical protein K439DRAFT_137465 [Ramaria rubella]|nr:hypothetical protein K439DRAFT_137465 [Ramaria rubella]